MAHATYLYIFVWVNYSSPRRDPIEIMLRIGVNYPQISEFIMIHPEPINYSSYDICIIPQKTICCWSLWVSL